VTEHTSGSPRLSITHEPDAFFSAQLEGIELFRYVYRPDDAQLESPRPYLHPIRTRSGREISLFRPHDHVWHKGIAWSLPNVGPHNFWGGTTYRRDRGYEQLDNNGSMDHLRVVDASVDREGAAFGHELAWRTQAGEELIREHRRLTARTPPPGAALGGAALGDAALDGAWLLTFETRMRNISAKAIPIGSPTTEGRDNAGYAGLFWRGPRSFTDGIVITAGGTGGEEVRGTRHPWLGYQGRHDGDGSWSTILMVDAPENPQHPPQWFVRSEPYACMNPAPFFSEVLVLAPRSEISFRYAVIIADGQADAERAQALAEWGGSVLGERATA
jgi:hypothetical protein